MRLLHFSQPCFSIAINGGNWVDYGERLAWHGQCWARRITYSIVGWSGTIMSPISKSSVFSCLSMLFDDRTTRQFIVVHLGATWMHWTYSSNNCFSPRLNWTDINGIWQHFRGVVDDLCISGIAHKYAVLNAYTISILSPLEGTNWRMYTISGAD